jgi:hypothetical protein
MSAALSMPSTVSAFTARCACRAYATELKGWRGVKVSPLIASSSHRLGAENVSAFKVLAAFEPFPIRTL